MKRIKDIVVVFIVNIFCMMAIVAQAQDIQTAALRWESSQVQEINSGELSNESHTITTRGKQTLEWKKGDGSTQQFTIGDVIGQWNNVSTSGEITYELISTNRNGSATFRKNGSETKVRLLLVDAQFNTALYELTIIAITPIQ